MGFWYYCAEKCCGANAYINRPSSVPHQNAYVNPYEDSQASMRSYAPLGGNPPAIDRQSDDWVLLKDGYGIRSDGSLWRWVSGIPFNHETGGGKIQFFDPGPWVWVSAAPNDDVASPWPNRLAAGIKADGTLWVWGSGGEIFSQGDGILHDWSWPSWQVALYGLFPTIRLDCPIDSVVSVFGNLSFKYNGTNKPEVRFTNSGLSYALVDTDQIEGRPAAQLRVLIDQQSVYYVQVTSGGSGYTSNPEVVFTPKGAVAQSVVVNGQVTYVRVMSGGTYSSPPAVSFVGGGGSGASAVAHADGNVTAFEVLDGGTGYNVGIPNLGEVEGWQADSSYYTTGKVKVWCDPPPCVGHVEGVRLNGGGSGYLLPAATIDIGGPGKGATAVATLDATGSLTSIQVTNGGSGYKTPGAAVIIQGDGQEAAAAAIVDRTGKIASIRIINPGHDYTKGGTTVSFSPVTETPAQVETVIDGGKIVAINVISGGSGYFLKSPPKVTITPIVAGVGRDASAVAVVNDSFELSAINVVSGGSGYMKPAPPTVTVSSSSGSGAEFVAEVNNSGVVTAVKVVRAGSGYPPVDMSLVFTPATGSLGSGASGVAYSIKADRHPTSIQPEIIGLLVAGIGKVHSATLSQPIKLNGPVNGLPDWRLTDCPGQTIGDGAVSGVIFPPLKPPTITYSQSTATKLVASIELIPSDLCEAPSYKTFDVVSRFTEAIPPGCTKIGPVQAKAVAKIYNYYTGLSSVEWAEDYFSYVQNFSVDFTPPEFSVHSGDAVTLASQVKLGKAVIGGPRDPASSLPPLMWPVDSWLFPSGLPFQPYDGGGYSPPFGGADQWASPEDKNSPAYCKIETAPYVSKVTQELSSYYPYPAYPAGYGSWGSIDIRASVLAGVSVPPSVPDDPLGSDFRPKCKGINRDAFLIPDRDPENGIGKVAVLEAQLQSIGGYVYVTGFTVTDPGNGFTKRPSFTDSAPQPSFVYGPSRAVYDGAGKYHLDSERPRKIDGSGWTSVEVVGARKIVAVRDQNVYHWGEIDSIYVTEPTRVGSSAVVRCSQVPSDRIGDVSDVVRPVTMSSPENGLVFPWSQYWQSIMGGFDWLANYAMPVIPKWTLQGGLSRYGDFAVDVFRDKPKHVSTKYFVKPVVSTPSNFGYLSPPTVTYHSLQPSTNKDDPFKLQATIHGPDGTASSVIRTSDGYYGILCSDGSLWSMYIMRPFPYGEGGVGVVGCERNAVQRKAILKTNYAWGDLELSIAAFAFADPFFGIGGDALWASYEGVDCGVVPSIRTFSEIVSQTRSYDYLITLESGGSGYTSESKLVFEYEHLARSNDPAQNTATFETIPCADFQKSTTPWGRYAQMAYKSVGEWTEPPVVVKQDSISVSLQYEGALDGSGRMISLPNYPLSVRTPEQDPAPGGPDVEPAQPWWYYDRLGRVINGGVPGTGPPGSLPHVLLNSVSPPTVHVEGPGSGAVFSVTKITDNFLQSIGGSGWNRVGTVNEKWSSVFAPRIGITRDGTVRRPIASGVSQPAGSETDGFSSVSLSRDPSLTAAYKTDGSLYVTDALSCRVHNELEMKVTSPGSGLTLVPTATLDQVPGVAKLSAKIDGKVVAFGVVNGGSGYTLAPSVTVTTRSGDSGSGAAGKAHICGPVVSMSVTTAGSGYKSPPRIKFSRPGLPAKATPRMKGFVDSITITDSGHGYTSPPIVSLIGDGKNASAKATIKGVVSEIIVTGGGQYSKSPTVTVEGGGGTGCKAVAAVSPSGDSYTVSRVIVTDSGSGYTSPPTVSFSPPGATAQAVLNAGVDSISITKAGEGYTSPPFVSISAASAISQASAVAGLSLSVDSISIERGGRYWYTPTATIVPRETITKLSLTSGGTGYSSAPDVLLVAGSGKGARASCKISGSVSTISILDGGVGYSVKYPPYVSLVGGFDVTVGRQAKAKVDVLGGKISAVTVTDGGSGYNSVPTVSLKWPVQATATAKVEGGVVTSIDVINPGAFYPATPRVEIRGGGGSEAEAVAIMLDGSVSEINVTKGGSLYASPPDVFVVYDPYGEGASLAATINASVSSVTLESQGEGYKVPPIVLFVGGGGDGAAVTVTTKAEGSGAAATCKINGSVQYIELTSQGSEYQYPPVVTMSKPQTGEETATAQSRILGKITSVSIDNGGSGYKANSPHKAYAFGGQYDLPYSIDSNVSATITLSANSSGEISSVTELPQEYFTQRPVIDMENGIGIRLRATLSQACLGVDHIGSKDSGSSKKTPQGGDWPLLTESELAWRGSLAAGVTDRYENGRSLPDALLNTTDAKAYIENEKGSGASVSLLNLTKSVTSPNVPRLEYSGGSDYLSRYEDGDVIMTIEESQNINLTATCTTTITKGAVTSVSASSPSISNKLTGIKVYFSGGGGTGASGYYTWQNGAVKITDGGSGYSSPPTVILVGQNPYEDSLEIVCPNTDVFGSRQIDPSITASSAVLDFVEQDQRSSHDRLTTPPPDYAHPFYDQGSVVDATFFYPDPDKIGRWNDSFKKQHSSPPQVSVNIVDGTAPEVKTEIAKWHPPVDDGSFIRDET